MRKPIEDYALIGDCITAALVAADGSIDWMCLPRFDSQACFAALLGSEENGYWRVAPLEPVRRVTRRYIPGTLILESLFETDQGILCLTDFMPPRSEEMDVIRLVRCEAGQVTVRMELCIRFDYGSYIPWISQRTFEAKAVAGPDSLFIDSTLPLDLQEDRLEAQGLLRSGDRCAFALTWHSSLQAKHRPSDPYRKFETTRDWWQKWSRTARGGPPHPFMERSLIVLKALTHLPTGGMVAAPSTSLPEEFGGVRNWDYRFCWLRDSAFTLSAFLATGYKEEAESWHDWLMRAVAGDPEQMWIVYGVDGNRLSFQPEIELPWLEGYEGSRPVRVGNKASHQLQLDVFGEVMDCLALGRDAGLAQDPDEWPFQRDLLAHLENVWREPDAGLWESRGEPQHYTYSKVMVWVAFDRGVKAVERYGLDGPVERWRNIRDLVHGLICSEHFDRNLNSFMQYPGSELIDASLLLLPIVGFLPASDPRVLGTVRLIEKRLFKDGFVYRYESEKEEDGLPGGEGSFLPCSFWLADNYLMQGRIPEALTLIRRLLSVANDLGLFAEEFDPKSGRLCGNFPQAFSHVALINTLAALERMGLSLEPETD